MTHHDTEGPLQSPLGLVTPVLTGDCKGAMRWSVHSGVNVKTALEWVWVTVWVQRGQEWGGSTWGCVQSRAHYRRQRHGSAIRRQFGLWGLQRGIRIGGGGGSCESRSLGEGTRSVSRSQILGGRMACPLRGLLSEACTAY